MPALSLRTTAASVSMVLETKECLRVKPKCIEKTFMSVYSLYACVNMKIVK